MSLKIIESGHPSLSEKCVPLTPFLNDRIEKLRSSMIEVIETEGIFSLSCPQVGFPYQMFVVKRDQTDGEYITFINPEIISFSEEKITYIEGCLSVPDIKEEIERPKYVKVRWRDERFNSYEKVLDEFLSRVFQHEYDHLNGISFVERVDRGYELGI